MRKYSLTVSYHLRLRAVNPRGRGGRQASAGICANKSSLATIFANPIYRGIKVFNKETRVDGEHGRKRRRNPQQDVVTSEVEPIVPEQLWTRVQDMLTRRRANRLPVRRYAGGYVLTELVRCACGGRMAGTNSRERRYYRCLARCGRPQVRADHLEAGVMDLIRTTLLTPDAIGQMVTLLNEDIRLRAEQRGPDLDRARAQVRRLEHQDANLRRALRTAGPRAAERITVEIETVSAELAAATDRLSDLQLTERPIRITKRMVDETIAQFEGILEGAPLETRVATVRDLFERVDVDSRELKALAVWNMTTDQGVNRSDAVSEWLGRDGANLHSRG